ncbi:MAG: protein kinase, partial [Planctomycetes bacterium]|nr:protein kinase [Planctomycetota bacterium]
GGLHYIVQEFVPGQTLEELLRKRPIDPERAAEILLQLAQAVGHAHARGVFHRDVKPENVLLDRSGAAKLTDFGLARRVGEATLTQTGVVFGTLAYMAPEQLDGKPTALSDLYGLGATLYEMLTGERPFGAETHAAIVRSIFFEEPIPPRQVVSGVPGDLEAICLRCLEKNSERRYPSASALVADVLAFLSGAPVSAREAGGPARWAHAKVKGGPTTHFDRERAFPAPSEEGAHDRPGGPVAESSVESTAKPRPALEVEPGEGERRCPNCREIIPARAGKCERCGTFYCPNCAGEVKIGEVRCPRCRRLLFRPTPSRWWSSRDRASRCRHCRAVPGGAFDHCYSCGAPFGAAERVKSDSSRVGRAAESPEGEAIANGLAAWILGLASMSVAIVFLDPRTELLGTLWKTGTWVATLALAGRGFLLALRKVREGGPGLRGAIVALAVCGLVSIALVLPGILIPAILGGS